MLLYDYVGFSSVYNVIAVDPFCGNVGPLGEAMFTRTVITLDFFLVSYVYYSTVVTIDSLPIYFGYTDVTLDYHVCCGYIGFLV